MAAPLTLVEMRKSYHKSLSNVFIGELDKDLTVTRCRTLKGR
ncbi:baeRF12 domain-containing protein [Rhizobium herbae]